MAKGKWIDGLSPGMSVAEAAELVLAARGAEVRKSLRRAVERAYDDQEHVHRLRVATRRATAALQAFGDAFPRKVLKAAKKALRTLRRAAGEARDWDVLLAALPEAKPLSTPSAKPALDFLLGYACGQRDSAQARLEAALAEAGPAFKEQSRELLDRVHKPRQEDPLADFGALATRQVGELLREFTAQVEANSTEPKALHTLRILAKRLRYALEIFVDCFPSKLREAVYPAIERVQEVLGEGHDAAVAIGRLAEIREQLESLVPSQAARVRPGIERLEAWQKARIHLATKQFAAWRKEWLRLLAALEL